MPSVPTSSPDPPQAVPRVRLDSWKEIAAYLGKGERTVKRWESERSLPVHRVPGHGHGSVYAFTAELDEWLLSEKSQGPPASDSAEPMQTDTASAPGQSNLSSPTGLPLRKPFGWFRRLLPYAILAISLAVLVGFFVNLHSVHAHASSLLRALLPKSRTIPADPEKQLAHELYLRGRFEWNRRTADSLNRALDYFTQAVVHDPSNSQAYVGLADTYNLLREYALMPENEAYARAIAAAKKAIELDESLAEAHRSLAFDEIWGNWDFEAGKREFQRAIGLNPRDPITRLWFANAFASPGWFEICLREIDRAQELDPASRAILADKGLMLYHAGKRREGLELVKQVALTDPEFLSPHRYLAEMYMDLSDYANFLRESDKAAEISHDQVLRDNIAAARAGFHREGERGLLHDLYLAQKTSYAEGKLPATLLAITCARLGKKKEAIRLLEEEYDKHSAVFLMFRQNLDLLTLKDEPGYRELVMKLHIPAPDVSDAHPAFGN